MLSSIISRSSKKRVSYSHQYPDDEGLRFVLTNLSNGNSNVVIKPMSFGPSDDQLCCYLKSCHLCQKPLRVDKETYMYSDLGFCSVECRDRQIHVDEMKEIETSTTSFRRQRCHGSGGLDDFRQRRHRFPQQKSRVIFL